MSKVYIVNKLERRGSEALTPIWAGSHPKLGPVYHTKLAAEPFSLIVKELGNKTRIVPESLFIGIKIGLKGGLSS